MSAPVIFHNLYGEKGASGREEGDKQRPRPGRTRGGSSKVETVINPRTMTVSLKMGSSPSPATKKLSQQVQIKTETPSSSSIPDLATDHADADDKMLLIEKIAEKEAMIITQNNIIKDLVMKTEDAEKTLQQREKFIDSQQKVIDDLEKDTVDQKKIDLIKKDLAEKSKLISSLKLKEESWIKKENSWKEMEDVWKTDKKLVSDLKEQFLIIQSENLLKSSDNQELSNKLEVALKENDNFKSLLGAQMDSAMDLLKTIEGLKSKVNKGSDDSKILSNLKKKLVAMESENFLLTKNFTDLQKMHHDTEKESDKLREKLARLEIENSDTKTELANTATELSQVVEKKIKDQNDIQLKLEVAEADLLRKNIELANAKEAQSKLETTRITREEQEIIELQQKVETLESKVRKYSDHYNKADIKTKPSTKDSNKLEAEAKQPEVKEIDEILRQLSSQDYTKIARKAVQCDEMTVDIRKTDLVDGLTVNVKRSEAEEGPEKETPAVTEIMNPAPTTRLPEDESSSPKKRKIPLEEEEEDSLAKRSRSVEVATKDDECKSPQPERSRLRSSSGDAKLGPEESTSAATDARNAVKDHDAIQVDVSNEDTVVAKYENSNTLKVTKKVQVLLKNVSKSKEFFPNCQSYEQTAETNIESSNDVAKVEVEDQSEKALTDLEDDSDEEMTLAEEPEDLVIDIEEDNKEASCTSPRKSVDSFSPISLDKQEDSPT